MDRWTHVDAKDVTTTIGAGSATASGEPKLAMETAVRLYDGEDRTAFDEGALTLTPYRLIWTSAEGNARAVEMLLSYIEKIETTGGFNLMVHKVSPKIVVRLHSVSPTARNAIPPSKWVRVTERASYCRLSFRGGHDQMEKFLGKLKSAVTMAAWKAPTHPQANRTTLGASAGEPRRTYGIGAILQKQKSDLEQSETTIREAFNGDLKALMERAKVMVALSEKFAAKIARGEADADETKQFQTYILSLGISNPITRNACKSMGAYHTELARELAEFLKEPLRKAKGIMLLQDVYCLYNRARGSQLISPDDLVQAAEAFPDIVAGMSLRTFASGVRVIQENAHSDTEVAARVLTELQNTKTGGSLSASQWATCEDISVTLALEQLYAAERCGSVCRDDSVEGLRFYPNRFSG
eukprot:m.194825 g.194825  ORF g.194825 m.194825 type:complete len:411 (+) comp18664_c0_seq2:205-1437(+)